MVRGLAGRHFQPLGMEEKEERALIQMEVEERLEEVESESLAEALLFLSFLWELDYGSHS